MRYGWIAGCGLLTMALGCAPSLPRPATVARGVRPRATGSAAEAMPVEPATAADQRVPDGASSPPPPAALAAATSRPSVFSPPAADDPFAALRPVALPESLPPPPSVRPREAAEGAALRQRIVVRVMTVPRGAEVHHHRRLLGTTPLTLELAQPGTPLDLVLTRAGYMLLRTRIEQRESRNYTFELTPGKLQ
ncbi:MAG: PEGA domain-containing protein [Proteobacteria bacterium]|nr:PEGA domain-containing protein [Pseudomonadota bacterium]